MRNPTNAIWRGRLGAASAALGLCFLSLTCLVYLRYVSDPSNMHAQERIQHAYALGLLWRTSFFGSMVLVPLSLFGRGWARWIGLLVNAGAFLFALMSLGAICGPFGC